MKGEIVPSLLSVLFPGNAILHGGKQLESMLQWKWWKPSHKFLSSSLVPQRKLVLLYVQQFCYETQLASYPGSHQEPGYEAKIQPTTHCFFLR